jgi:hypothetical protein
MSHGFIVEENELPRRMHRGIKTNIESNHPDAASFGKLAPLYSISHYCRQVVRRLGLPTLDYA